MPVFRLSEKRGEYSRYPGEDGPGGYGSMTGAVLADGELGHPLSSPAGTFSMGSGGFCGGIGWMMAAFHRFSRSHRDLLRDGE